MTIPAITLTRPSPRPVVLFELPAHQLYRGLRVHKLSSTGALQARCWRVVEQGSEIAAVARAEATVDVFFTAPGVSMRIPANAVVTVSEVWS